MKWPLWEGKGVNKIGLLCLLSFMSQIAVGLDVDFSGCKTGAQNCVFNDEKTLCGEKDAFEKKEECQEVGALQGDAKNSRFKITFAIKTVYEDWTGVQALLIDPAITKFRSFKPRIVSACLYDRDFISTYNLCIATEGFDSSNQYQLFMYDKLYEWARDPATLAKGSVLTCSFWAEPWMYKKAEKDCSIHSSGFKAGDPETAFNFNASASNLETRSAGGEPIEALKRALAKDPKGLEIEGNGEIIEIPWCDSATPLSSFSLPFLLLFSLFFFLLPY